MTTNEKSEDVYGIETQVGYQILKPNDLLRNSANTQPSFEIRVKINIILEWGINCWVQKMRFNIYIWVQINIKDKNLFLQM